MEPSYAPLDLCVQRYRVTRQMFPMKDAAVSYGYTLCAKLPACAATVGGSDPLMRIPHCNCERVRSEDPDRRLGASPSRLSGAPNETVILLTSPLHPY